MVGEEGQGNPEEGFNILLEKYWNIIQASDAQRPEQFVLENILREMLNQVEGLDSRFKMGVNFSGGNMYEKVAVYRIDRSTPASKYSPMPVAPLRFEVKLPIIQLTTEELPVEWLSKTHSGCTTFHLPSSLQKTWKDLTVKSGKFLMPDKIIKKFNELMMSVYEDKDGTTKYGYRLILDNANHDLPHGYQYTKKRMLKLYDGGNEICDFDLVPVIEVKKWPDCLTAGLESRRKHGWPSTELLTQIKQGFIYLIPDENLPHDRHLLWRITSANGMTELFNEREIALSNSCCHKVIGILNGFELDLSAVEPYRWLTYEVYPEDLRTIMLQELQEYPAIENWQESKLGERLMSIMKRLQDRLPEGKCIDYFIADSKLRDFYSENWAKQIVVSDVERFFDDPVAKVAKMIEFYKARKICRQMLGPFEAYVEDLFGSFRKAMERDEERRARKRKLDEEVASEETKDIETEVELAVPQEKDEDEKICPPIHAMSLFDIPTEFVIELGDFLDFSDTLTGKCWRDEFKRSKDVLENSKNFHKMLDFLKEQEWLERGMRKTVGRIADHVYPMPQLRKMIFWDGKDSTQFSGRSLEIDCNFSQEGFEWISRSLPFHRKVAVVNRGNNAQPAGKDVAVTKMLEFDCTAWMLSHIESASQANMISLYSLEIWESASISEGPFLYFARLMPFINTVLIEGKVLQRRSTELIFPELDSALKASIISLRELTITETASVSEVAMIYFANLIPFIESVHIKGQVFPQQFPDTLMTVSKSLDCRVKTKKLGIECRKNDNIGEIVKFFPLVEKVVLSNAKLTWESMVSFATSSAETFNRETKTGGTLPLKDIKLRSCEFDEGVGWQLMKALSFVESVQLVGSDFSTEHINAMANCLSEMKNQADAGDIVLKTLLLGPRSCLVDRSWTLIMNLASLIENVVINLFYQVGNPSGACLKVVRALSEFMKQDTEQIWIKEFSIIFRDDCEDFINEDIVVSGEGLGRALLDLNLLKPFARFYVSTCVRTGLMVLADKIWGVTELLQEDEIYEELIAFEPVIRSTLDEFDGLDLRNACSAAVELRKISKGRSCVSGVELSSCSLGGQSIGADIMKLAAMGTYADLCENDFEAEDLHEMGLTMSEMLKFDKECVRIKKIDMSKCELGGKGSGRAIGMIISHIEDVSLLENVLERNDLQGISDTMSEMRKLDCVCIKKLDLSHCDLGGKGSGVAIGKIICPIEDVSLHDNNFQGDDLQGMEQAVFKLMKLDRNCFRIKKLDLKDCQLAGIGMESGRAMGRLVSLINEVCLDCNKFQPEDMKGMAVGMSEMAEEKTREDRFHLKKLSLQECSLEGKGMGTDIGNVVALVENVDLYGSAFEASDMQEMSAAFSELMSTSKSCFHIKKLNLKICQLEDKEMGMSLVKLISAVEDVDLSSSYFGSDDFRLMHETLLTLLKQSEDRVHIKTLKMSLNNSKTRVKKDKEAANIMGFVSLIENVHLSPCFSWDWRSVKKMVSDLSKLLENDKDQVHLKKLKLSCSLQKVQKLVVKLLRMVEELDLRCCWLSYRDYIAVAKFLEKKEATTTTTTRAPQKKNVRTKSFLLPVSRESLNKIKEVYAKMAFSVNTLCVDTCGTALKFVKQLGKMAIDCAIQGRKCRLKNLKVVIKNEDQEQIQKLVNMANEIGVSVTLVNEEDGTWGNGCKFIINGSSEEIHETKYGYVCLCVPKEEDINWKISKVSCHIDLAIGEAVLSDVILIGPEGKSFTKTATLNIPYNIYEVPASAKVVCECLNVETNQWEKVVAMFSRDDYGMQYATVNVQVATKYMISLRLEKMEDYVAGRGQTVSGIGGIEGDKGSSVTFPYKLVGTYLPCCNFMQTSFTRTGIQRLQRLGYTASPMLHFEIKWFTKSEEAIKVKLPIKNTPGDDIGQLVVLCWNGLDFIDVTKDVNPKLLDGAVVCEINQTCKIIAVICSKTVQARISTLSRDILKYIEPQLEMRFYLYVKDVHDPDYCIACSCVENRSIVDEKLRPMGYEMVAENLAMQGVFENTEMRIDVGGRDIQLRSWNSPKMRLHEGKWCCSENFSLKHFGSQVEIFIVDETDGTLYATFNLPVVAAGTSLSYEPEGVRFLGLKLENCYLKDINLQNNTEINKLRKCLGLRKKQVKKIKEVMRTEAERGVAMKLAWKEITNAFVKGYLDEDRLNNFGKLEPARMSERILEVTGFLEQTWMKDNDAPDLFLAEIIKSKIFEEIDIVMVFCKRLGFTESKIKEHVDLMSQSGEVVLLPKGNRCLKLVLEYAFKSGTTILKIVKSLLATKLHFKVFKPDSRKDLLVQTLLDGLGKIIEEHVIAKCMTFMQH